MSKLRTYTTTYAADLSLYGPNGPSVPLPVNSDTPGGGTLIGVT